MKILLKQNVPHLGRLGDVVEVRQGYARNYLLPQGLGVRPTQANLKAIEAEKQRYLEQLAREQAEMQAKAAAFSGKEVTISARANEEGHLYGSVGPAQIAAALAEEGVFAEPGNIVLDEPIRRLDKYDVQLRFGPDATATIAVWIVPIHDAESAPEAEQTGEDDPAAGSPAAGRPAGSQDGQDPAEQQDAD